MNFWGNSEMQKENKNHKITNNHLVMKEKGTAIGQSYEFLKITWTHILKMMNAFMIYQGSWHHSQQITVYHEYV